jgi:hypothetical protein
VNGESKQKMPNVNNLTSGIHKGHLIEDLIGFRNL